MRVPASVVPSCAGQASALSGVNSNLWLRGLAQRLLFLGFFLVPLVVSMRSYFFSILSVSEGFGCGELVFPLRQPMESLESECGRDRGRVWTILVFLLGF